MGVRPVFYTQQADQLIFGSEIKALFAHPAVQPADRRGGAGADFTFWSTLAPHTIFRDIYELPPAHYLIARDGEVTVQPYWTLNFAEESPRRSDAEYLDEFTHLLIDATLIRLRADVPVGAYLSGGLDSSVTTAIIKQVHDQPVGYLLDRVFRSGVRRKRLAAAHGRVSGYRSSRGVLHARRHRPRLSRT